MPFTDVYIGWLAGGADELDFGGTWESNGPRRQGPFFPPPAPFVQLIRAIEAGRYPGRRLDWGAWGAILRKAQILDFLDEQYGPPGQYEADNAGQSRAHLAENMRELRAFVAALPEDRRYALCASEL